MSFLSTMRAFMYRVCKKPPILNRPLFSFRLRKFQYFDIFSLDLYGTKLSVTNGFLIQFEKIGTIITLS